MCQEKPFMTYKEQIIKLRDDKKLEIADENHAIELLKEHSYFALISGYKKPFKAKDGNYKLHTSIDDIYALYLFDDSIRNLFLRFILKIEKHIKSLMSYSFCEEYGESQQHYLNATNYNYNINTQAQINILLNRLNDKLTNNKDYPYIKHQQEKHGNVPLWVMTKALTLGTISKKKEDFEAFIQVLNIDINKLMNDTKSIPKSQLLKYMGFPSNWLDIRDCDKVISMTIQNR